MTTNCSVCGTTSQSGASFCGNCGRRIQGRAEVGDKQRRIEDDSGTASAPVQGDNRSQLDLPRVDNCASAASKVPHDGVGALHNPFGKKIMYAGVVAAIGILILTLAITRRVTARVSDSTSPLLAVMPFEARGGVGEIGATAGDLLTSALVRRGRFRVVERVQIEALFREQGRALSGLVDASTATELGKMLGASYLVVGSISALGKEMFISIRLIDVASGVSVSAVDDRIDSVDLLSATCDKMSKYLSSADLPHRQGVTSDADRDYPVTTLKDRTVVVIIPETVLTRQVRDPAAETAIVAAMIAAGVKPVAPEAVGIDRYGAQITELIHGTGTASAAPDTSIAFDYLLVGEAVADRAQTQASSSFVTWRARVEAKLVDRNGKQVLASVACHESASDTSDAMASKAALSRAGETIARAILKQMSQPPSR